MTATVLVAATSPGSEVLGAAIAVGAAILYDAGYVLEKQALTGLPEVSLHPGSVLRTARSSTRWSVGFAAMLAGMVLRVGALTLAPVSVVQPILAGGLIALAAAGSSFLGERLTRLHAVALLLVLVAVVTTGISANGRTDLATRVPGGHFLVLAVIVMAVVVLAALWHWRAGGLQGGRAALNDLLATSVAAGLLYGLGAVAEKAVSTRMVTRGLVWGVVSSLGTPYPWIFLVATLAGMLVFQVGLQAQPASLMASLTNVTSTGCALVGASTVFGEALLPGGWWSLPRLVGFTAVVAAVVVLALDVPRVEVRPDLSGSASFRERSDPRSIGLPGGGPPSPSAF